MWEKKNTIQKYRLKEKVKLFKGAVFSFAKHTGSIIFYYKKLIKISNKKKNDNF